MTSATIATTKLALTDLLVDPSRFSPRAVPLEPGHTARLVEAYRAGEPLPLLRVALPVEPRPDWCGCPRAYNQAQRAGYMALQARRPGSSLPLAPKAVLIDGLTAYWAARELGLRDLPCTVDPEPVVTIEQVLLRAMAANARHGRRLTDSDLRVTFARLWLGRDPWSPGREKWQPHAGAVPLAELAAAMGRGEAWCSRMILCVQVCCATRLDLGFAAAGLLGRLDPDRWEPFCWEGSHLRAYAIPRPDGTHRLATVPELTAAELERLVNEILAQEPVDSGLGLPSPAAGRRVGGEDSAVQLQLPFDLADYIPDPLARFRQLRPLVRQMGRDQAREVLRTIRPLYIEVHALFKEASALAGPEDED